MATFVEAPPLPVITPARLAVQLGLSEKTLANWRAANRGPRFIRLGAKAGSVYLQSDVMAWLESQRVDDTYWAA